LYFNTHEIPREWIDTPMMKMILERLGLQPKPPGLGIEDSDVALDRLAELLHLLVEQSIVEISSPRLHNAYGE
jgi:hypothetical protein